MPRVKRQPTESAATVAALLNTPAAITELLKDYPAVDVLSRRFVDASDPGSLPILLKGESSDCCMNSDHQRLVKPGQERCQARDPDTRRKCGKPVRQWRIYTCNTKIEGRWAQMRSKGYIPVEVRELLDAQDVSDLVRQTEDDGKVFVRRGDRGAEVTMKIPLIAYNYIKAQQLAERQRRSTSKAAMREDLARDISANAELGSSRDDVAEDVYLGRGAIQIESVQRERTTLGEEAEAE